MDITQLIANLGFPIVCCIVLFKQNNDLIKSHKEEMDKVTESVNNNTLALTKLCERIGGADGDDNEQT